MVNDQQLHKPFTFTRKEDWIYNPHFLFLRSSGGSLSTRSPALSVWPDPRVQALPHNLRTWFFVHKDFFPTPFLPSKYSIFGAEFSEPEHGQRTRTYVLLSHRHRKVCSLKHMCEHGNAPPKLGAHGFRNVPSSVIYMMLIPKTEKVISGGVR